MANPLGFAIYYFVLLCLVEVLKGFWEGFFEET